MSNAVVQVDKCFVAVVEPLDEINELRQSSLFAQDIGHLTILYGDSDEFFENLNKPNVKLRSVHGAVAATFKYN